ncbi:type II toxin-antitoxin system RelE/ParE family toxin [Methylomonas paludis]|uniref:Type II toxin-antitoxin system RelE/ParE family toxin n=1 Tax=Methylomonas paludis TaxID=1173101 RepID=A0A975MPH2_9GAMM|nr:type II toxin-antitoxin system RelE/ParE family toxin [Methylomonas paludis]QWF71577.1 type II toxin-antitoxin system RelE/ParE family toxin [Methylomonas paludis]
MAEINWTDEAELWLKEIYDYIAQDKQQAAENVIFGIFQKVDLLADHPEIGHFYRKETDGDIRILLYGHYRIAYIIKNQSQIDILGVFHGALNIDLLI